MFCTRTRLVLLLALIFAMNYFETSMETWLKERQYITEKNGYVITETFHHLEEPLSFEYHDRTNLVAVYGYSISYFFAFPLLGLAIVLALALRKELLGFQMLCYAAVIDYLLSLPFFLFFPVVERWAHSNSGAILLSDIWSTKLIEMIRPISGLDNSFPSFHVSLSTVIILVAYFSKLRFRTSILVIGLTVILSTFVLGIHWLPDMIAGLSVGILSVALARRFAAAMAMAHRPQYSG